MINLNFWSCCSVNGYRFQKCFHKRFCRSKFNLLGLEMLLRKQDLNVTWFECDILPLWWTAELYRCNLPPVICLGLFLFSQCWVEWSQIENGSIGAILSTAYGASTLWKMEVCWLTVVLVLYCLSLTWDREEAGFFCVFFLIEASICNIDKMQRGNLLEVGHLQTYSDNLFFLGWNIV